MGSRGSCEHGTPLRDLDQIEFQRLAYGWLTIRCKPGLQLLQSAWVAVLFRHIHGSFSENRADVGAAARSDRACARLRSMPTGPQNHRRHPPDDAKIAFCPD